MNRLPNLAEFERLLSEQLPQVRERFGVLSLEVFGSYLRGEAHSDSDVDVLVRFRNPPGLLRFIALENHLSDVLGVRVDLVMPEALKPGIRHRVLAEVAAR